MKSKTMLSYIMIALLIIIASACGGDDSSDDSEAPANGTAANGDDNGTEDTPVVENGDDDGEVELDLAEIGRGLFTSTGCLACHTIGDEGTEIGPELTDVGARLAVEEIRAVILDPQGERPGSVMTKFELTDEELEALVTYLSGLK